MKLINAKRADKLKLLYNNTLKKFNNFLSDNGLKNYIVVFDNQSNIIEVSFKKYTFIIYLSINNDLLYIIKSFNKDTYISKNDIYNIDKIFNFYKEEIKDYL